MKDRSNLRVAVCFALLGMIAPIVVVRLAYLQIIDASWSRERVRTQRLRSDPLPPPHGTIVDRHGALLAYDRPVMDVRAELALPEGDPAAFVSRCAADLATALAVDGGRPTPRALLEERIHTAREGGGSRIDFLVASGIDSAAVLERLRAFDEQRTQVHLHYMRDYARTYPDREFTIGPVGFQSWRELENGRRVPVRRGMESFAGLQPGRGGAALLWQDSVAERYWTAQGETPARAAVLQCTLDLELQKGAHEELRAAVRKVEERYKEPPEWGALMLAEIETGDVLAMASYRRDADGKAAAFAPLQSICPPGSVVKPLVFSMALERGVLNWHDDIFDCAPNTRDGRWRVPGSGRTIGDEHDCGLMTPRQILVESSNVGAVQVGLLLGREGFLDYLDRYRFGETTALRLPGESAGSLTVEKLGGIMGMPQGTFWGYTGPSLSFGYEYNLPPIQILRAYLTMLSGRERELRLYQRYAVDGEVVEVPPPPRGERFLSDRTLALLRDALAGVVSDEPEATGRHLHAELVEGGHPAIAGKTGTSEFQQVRDGKTVWVRTASFAGFVPVDRPRYLAVCVLQKPRAVRFWGGVYAAPAAGRLLLRALSPPSSERSAGSQVSADPSQSAGAPARLAVGR